MKRLAAWVVTGLMAAALIAGCGNQAKNSQGSETNKQPEKTENTENVKATEGAESTESTAGEADKSQKLIIYTNSGADGRAEWLSGKAAEAGYNIEVVDIGGGELASRVIAEKNNSQADLIFGLNALEYEKLKAENLLLKYEPSWVGEVDMSLGDPDGYYYPIVIQPLVLMYNNEYKDAPSDWTDLANEKYKDQFTLLTLSGGTGKAIYASILARYLDEKGELGVSAEGWEMVKQIFANGYTAAQGEDYVGKAIDGTRPMTTMWGSGVLQNQAERNYQFEIMSPEVGVPYVVEQAVILSTTSKAALAEEFINWFGSPEFQVEWSKEFGTIPAAAKAQEQVSAETKDFLGKVHSQEINWGIVAKYMDQWVEKAELEFVR